MSSQLPIALAIIFALGFSPNVCTTRAQQMSLTSDQRQVVDTVSTIFTAARADDVAKFDSVIAPGFYIFDVGARFSGDSIMDLIKAQHAAWIAYVNKGSVTDASGTVNQNWLESAFLEKQTGTWKIVFMHSTRVPVASQESQRK
jgi:hypothetical protein